MSTTKIVLGLTSDEAQAVYALIHDWKWEFMRGHTILTDRQVRHLQSLYDYIEELTFTNEPGEAS